VVLYTSLEDLIAENDRRYEEQLEENTTEYVIHFVLHYAQFYFSDKIACNVVISHLRRLCLGYTPSFRNSTSMTAKIC